jgi:DNA polymerase III epsilon subunit family exonuclease
MTDFVVIDIETTGLSHHQGARITEIGALRTRDGIVVDSFQSLVNPETRIPYEVIALTGITNEMVAEAPPIKMVLEGLVEFVGESPTVAHNASFDGGFITNELQQFNRNNQMTMLCTLLLSRRLFPNLRSYSLGNLAAEMNFKKRDFHRAIADCEATVELLQLLEGQVNAFAPSDFGFTADNLIKISEVPPTFFRQYGIEEGLSRANIIKGAKPYKSLQAIGLR